MGDLKSSPRHTGVRHWPAGCSPGFPGTGLLLPGSSVSSGPRPPGWRPKLQPGRKQNWTWGGVRPQLQKWTRKLFLSIYKHYQTGGAENGTLTRSVCTPCPPCNPTGSGASWWCHRLVARLRPRWPLAEPLARRPDAERERAEEM